MDKLEAVKVNTSPEVVAVGASVPVMSPEITLLGTRIIKVKGVDRMVADLFITGAGATVVWLPAGKLALSYLTISIWNGKLTIQGQ